MTPTEAVDLLSVAARSSTWSGASPELARELLEVLLRNADPTPTPPMSGWERAEHTVGDAMGLRREEPKPTPPACRYDDTRKCGGCAPGDCEFPPKPTPGFRLATHEEHATVGPASVGTHIEQPLPTGDGQEVFPVALEACTSKSLREMLAARDLIGRQRYGTTLKTGNGRDMRRDAREELADAFLYLTGAALEAKAAGRITWVIENARESVEDAWRRLGGAE
jgi:hypothetical protein